MSNVNNIKEIFTIPEIAQMTGMSGAKVRALIKSGTINGNLNINAVNENGRKVKRTEVTKNDLVEFVINNPELAGPLMDEEFVQEKIAALTCDRVDEDDPAEEISADGHTTEESAVPDASSTELPATENILTLSKPDVDNADVFEETAPADTENYDNLSKSVIAEYINDLTINRAAFENKRREIEDAIKEIDRKLENATKALNQIREYNCMVNCEE